MGQGISEVLTWAVDAAISPIPIIAVILMLFSPRARVHGTAFPAGWILSLAALSTVVYALAHDGNVAAVWPCSSRSLASTSSPRACPT